MVYYHGTTDAWVKSILKEGLKPDLKNAWKISGTQFWNAGQHLRAQEPVKWVYITKQLKKAKRFAEAKAEYLGLKPGEESSYFYMTKDKGAPIIEGVKPVVLKIDLPDSYNLSEDPRDDKDDCFRYEGTIPPSCISVLKGVKA